MDSIELLSPAGGREAFVAAVQNGADAVYFGAKNFNARNGAENFDAAAMREAVSYASVRNVKTYLTLNTLVSDNELNDFYKTLEEAASCGVSGLIVQDLGGARIAKEVCPTIELHASTQMSAHNEKDVEALLQYGFSRVVLARELKRREIERIYKNTHAELEVFVHGALCICVSGQCLMSSFIGGRSGNRGSCAQPCRRLYTAEGKRGYFLSPRDLCLLDEIRSLKDAGVQSLKIEGRMKSPEYVAAVTAMYRKYIDDPHAAEEKDIEELEKVFVRGDGFTKGYYAGLNTPEIMNYDIANDNISQKADKDILKKAALTFRDGAENKKVPVDAFFTLKRGKKALLELTDGVNSVKVEGSSPENAVNVPLTYANAKERISKTGGTPYIIRSFGADIDDKITISAKEINALRRNAIELLTKKCGEIHPHAIFPLKIEKRYVKRENMYLAAQVMNKEQLKAAGGADMIYMPLTLYEKADIGVNSAVVLPKVIYDMESYIKRLKAARVKTVLASTIGTAQAVIEAGFECMGDFGLNVYNAVSAAEYSKMGLKGVTLSPECSVEAIRDITCSCTVPCEVMAYGRMMMMVTRACVIKGARRRCSCERPLVLKDRLGAEFLVYGDDTEHLNNIYNSAVTFTADKLGMLKSLNASGIRLTFTDESPEETKRIIAMYKGEAEPVLPQKYTRGYFAEKKHKKIL